jgi:hypothetical protein
MAHVAPRVSALGQTVYYHFYKWRRDGRLRRAHDRLREALRKAEGRERNPSGAMIDSQSVKATGVGGEERGIEPPAGGHRRALVLGARVSTRRACTTAMARKFS